MVSYIEFVDFPNQRDTQQGSASGCEKVTRCAYVIDPFPAHSPVCRFSAMSAPYWLSFVDDLRPEWQRQHGQ